MTKHLYVLAWFLLGAKILVSALDDTLTPEVLLLYSIPALGLVFALMLWSVISNTRAIKTD